MGFEGAFVVVVVEDLDDFDFFSFFFDFLAFFGLGSFGLSGLFELALGLLVLFRSLFGNFGQLLGVLLGQFLRLLFGEFLGCLPFLLGLLGLVVADGHGG